MISPLKYSAGGARQVSLVMLSKAGIRCEYEEESDSMLAWVYNTGDPECSRAIATNQLIARLAATLRTMNGEK
jgi:hypothetical protein